MPCTVCDELSRDYRREGEVEATAILEQRISLLDRREAKPNLDETILSSRKRQAQIAFRLNAHRANHHSVARAAS